MPAEVGDRLFERGFTTKPGAVVGGRGIGLSLVRRICEARGGSVALRCGSPGATFVAELPTPVGDVEAEAEAKSAGQPAVPGSAVPTAGVQPAGPLATAERARR